MDRENFGKFIKTIRQEKSMTQKDLAKELNLTDKAISKWERGLSFPDITSLEILSNIFGITVSELIACQKSNQHKKNTKSNIPLRFILQCGTLGVLVVVLVFAFFPQQSNSYKKVVGVSYDSYELLGEIVETLAVEEIPFVVYDGFISCDAKDCVEQFLAVTERDKN